MTHFKFGAIALVGVSLISAGCITPVVVPQAPPSPTSGSTATTALGHKGIAPVQRLSLTAEEAAERALWLSNPNGAPRTLFAHYVRAGDVRPGKINVGFDCCTWLSTLADDEIVIVVGTAADTVASLSCNAAEQGALGYSQTGAVFHASTDRLLEVGPVGIPQSGIEVEGMAALAAVPTLAVTPLRVAVPTETPATIGVATATPPSLSTADSTRVPAGIRPSEAAATEALSPALRGRPLTRAGLSLAVVETLQDWPLLPGNWWAYRGESNGDEYRGVWSGGDLREEVVAAEALRDDLVVVQLRQSERPSRETALAVAHGYLSAHTISAELTRNRFKLIHGGDVYDVSDGSELGRLVERLTSGSLLPTVAPWPEYDSASPVPIPDLRLPLLPGAQRPVPAFGANWIVDEPSDVSTLAGTLHGCYPEGYSANAKECRWICPGVGIVRSDYAHQASYSTKRLVDHGVVMTVDDLP
jgi:hypothetical protein